MLKSVFTVVLLFSLQSFAQHVKLSAALNPAGDFVAESDLVTGNAFKNADGSVEAANIKVLAASLKTNVKLRDEHLWKELDVKAFPEILLKVAKGKDGKGEAILVIKGKQGKVAGTYTEEKGKLNSTFKVSLKAFGFKDIVYKGIGVEDEVMIEVSVPLMPKAGGAKPVAGKPAPAAPKK
ncbi:MAG: YceI family protein [Pseudobdellovibrio sp.]